MIDVVYGKNLKDVMILDTLCKHETPDLDKLDRILMRRIQEYFGKVEHSEIFLMDMISTLEMQ